MRQPKPEWSFTVDVADIGNAPAHYKIAADQAVCADLAERFGILGIDAASAHLVLTRERGGAVIHVTGTVAADVVQECVVTLTPLTAHVTDEVDAYFTDRNDVVPFARANAARAARKGVAVEVELIDEATEPERAVNGQIDLGEVASQFLSLALDPYPRRADWASAAPRLLGGDPAVAFGTDVDDVREDGDVAGAAAPQSASPFAALKAWKDSL